MFTSLNKLDRHFIFVLNDFEILEELGVLPGLDLLVLFISCKLWIAQSRQLKRILMTLLLL